MTNLTLSETGSSPFEKLIGHNPEILKHWLALEETLFTKTSLSSKLLEQVRRTLAFGNACEYCMVKEGKPDIAPDEKQIQIACAFAQQFALDHKDISSVHFNLLKEEFSEGEISELISFISFITACQQMGKVYNLGENEQINKKSSLQELTQQ